MSVLAMTPNSLNPIRTQHAFVTQPHPLDRPDVGVWLTTGGIDTLQMRFNAFSPASVNTSRLADSFKKSTKKAGILARTTVQAPGRLLRAIGSLALRAWEDFNPSVPQQCVQAGCSGH